ncbi:hypothetical protein BHE74_00007213 [Ensete ventricosum]|nr:hypothetical protein BHE74_00007213 [Ensete ventricosum]RZS28469.1 hypothetical protein BHM03_00062064 [Ensete ventricosum]
MLIKILYLYSIVRYRIIRFYPLVCEILTSIRISHNYYTTSVFRVSNTISSRIGYLQTSKTNHG